MANQEVDDRAEHMRMYTFLIQLTASMLMVCLAGSIIVYAVYLHLQSISARYLFLSYINIVGRPPENLFIHGLCANSTFWDVSPRGFLQHVQDI